jgi:hypothetical protein
MDSQEVAEERLLALAQAIHFASRYYAIVSSTRSGKPCFDLSGTEIAAALESTGRTFRFNRKEKFYATREPGTPGELGVNLSINGSVEFILVARAPVGHIGPTFHGLALDLAQRHAPELVPNSPYPQPWYRDAAELKRVLAEGFELYADLASAIIASRLLNTG